MVYGRGGVKDWEGTDLQTEQQRSGTVKATDVWRTVRGAPHFTTTPACSPGAESAAVTLKLYHFHPEPGQEATVITLSSENQVSRIIVILISKKACCFFCLFVKLIISTSHQTQFLPFSVILIDFFPVLNI